MAIPAGGIEAGQIGVKMIPLTGPGAFDGFFVRWDLMNPSTVDEPGGVI